MHVFSLATGAVALLLIGSVATAQTPPQNAAPTDGAGQSMFNGTDLSGWRGRQDLWSVEDGAITGKTTDENPIDGNTFLVWETDKPGNFELRCQFKIDGGNSGIQYRSKVVDEAKYVVAGYQADIDAEGKYAGINYEEKGRGILALRGQRVTLLPGNDKQEETFGDAAEIGKVIRQGEWNAYRIVAQGNRLQHYINDTLTCEVIDKDPEARARSGVIALQLHRGPAMKVQFKDLQIQIKKKQNQKQR